MRTEEIPAGIYCYRILNITKREKDNMPIIQTKDCPYYHHIEEIDGYCNFLKCSIEDQCKICDINWDFKYIDGENV